MIIIVLPDSDSKTMKACSVGMTCIANITVFFSLKVVSHHLFGIYVIFVVTHTYVSCFSAT